MPNLKLALRALLKTPFVTAVAIVSLAMGIGANAAIFSLFDQILLRPLPVPEPARLVNLAAPGPKPGSQSCGQAGDCDVVFSYPMFRDLERAQDVLTGLAGHVVFGANLALRGKTPLSSEGMLVSGSYFPVLGVAAAQGRLFTPADDQTIGASLVAVLSYGYWERELGLDPSVLGQTIIVNGQALTIVGVAPKGFEGTTLGVRPQVFVPLTMRGLITPGWTGFEDRRSYWLYLFGRLKPGVSVQQAGARMDALYHPIINDVEASLQTGMSDQTMARFKAKKIGVEDGRKGQSSLHNNARTPLMFLFGVTGLVLLIACANIANLLLARGAQRSGEVAVRLALGATRGQLLIQLLSESCLLALLGGAASLLVGMWTLSGIKALLPADGQTLNFGLEGRVVLFTALLSLATGVVFGMFPALHSTRPDLIGSIRASAGQLAGARAAARFRTSLVTAQIAFSMALLIAAGLFVRSLVNITRVDLGIRAENVVTFGVSPELNGYSNERSRVLFERMREELTAIPGVTGVTTAMVPLLAGNNWGNNVSVEGFKKDPDTDDNSRFNEVGPEYFQTLGVPLLAGRDFVAGDLAGAPRVAIVNEAFAKKFNLGREAVGKHMAAGDGPALDIEIVGLATNAKYSDVKDEVPPLFFTPYRQDTTVGSLSFYLRTAVAPEAVLRAIPATIAKLDPNLPVENLKTLRQQARDNFFVDRMLSMLSAAFAVLATMLAAVGVYGVLAYTVALRTREIGVRMALGANERQVRGLVMRQVLRVTAIGGVIGVLAALALGRAVRSLLYGLAGADPIVFVLSVVALASVALFAGYLPALRASRVHPVQALRYE